MGVQRLIASQSWLDERLFGWSPEYLGDSDMSRGTSGMTTPVYSEDEAGDYDNLLGYVDSRRPSIRTRSSSYADLRLRKTTSSTNLILGPAVSPDGIPFAKKPVNYDSTLD